MPSVFPRHALLVVVALAAIGCGRVHPHVLLPTLRLGEPSFFPTLEAYAQAPIVGGNDIRILLNGNEIFPAMLDAIRSAAKSISYAQYTFDDGPVAEEFVDALAERCRAGVKANILLDGFGSLQLSPAYPDRLSRAGCHVVFFRPIRPFQLAVANNRNHRRILVVDGRIGFTGGSGVGREWLGDGRTEGYWRETDVRVEGPAVAYLQGAFAENWLEATGVVLGGDEFFPSGRAAKGKAFAQVIRSSPVSGVFGLYTTFLLAMSSARRSIHITSPYFLLDETMLDALAQAVNRKAKVVLLAPRAIDHALVRQAGRRQYGRLLRAGVEIHEYLPARLHAKTMVVDGVWATVGSTNFDNRSFALNAELNLVVYDAEIAQRLERVFADDLAHARRVTYEAWRRRALTERLLEILAIPFRDQL